MDWKNITVRQFQEINEAIKVSNDSLDLDMRLVGIVNRLSINDVGSMTRGEFKVKLKEISFMNRGIEGLSKASKPVRHVKINGKRYRFLYDIRKLPVHRVIEAKHFEANGGIIDNLHKIAASMIVPQRKNIFGIWIDREYSSLDHEDYSNDMLDCPITLVHGCVLFFCKVFASSMKVLKDYIAKEMMRKTSITKEEALSLNTHLCSVMDGLTKQLSLPSMKE